MRERTSTEPTGASAPCPACGGRLGRTVSDVLVHDGFEYVHRRCASCATCAADPAPSPALLDALYAPRYVDEHYADELGPGAGGEEITDDELAGERAHALELAVRHAPGKRLLDVGCGSGAFLEQARAAGLDPTGYEVHPDSAARVARRTGLPVHHGALDALPSFDAVHLADVLEHSPTPLDLLAGAARRLAPGGVLVLRGPLEGQRSLFLGLMRARARLRTLLRGPSRRALPPYHVVLFSLRGWEALLARAGLVIVSTEVSEIAWPAGGAPLLSPVGVAKRASMALSRSGPGRRAHLGNRVLTIARRS